MDAMCGTLVSALVIVSNVTVKSICGRRRPSGARLVAQILAKARAVKGSIRRNLRAFIEQGLQYEKVTIYTLQSIYNIE